MAKNTPGQQVFCLLVQEERKKKFWQPEIAIWRLKILVQSPVGANIKMLISDPGLYSMLAVLQKLYIITAVSGFILRFLPPTGRPSMIYQYLHILKWRSLYKNLFGFLNGELLSNE